MNIAEPFYQVKEPLFGACNPMTVLAKVQGVFVLEHHIYMHLVDVTDDNNLAECDASQAK